MENALLSIYGARKSKDGKRVNITLCNGEGKSKNYYTCSVALDGNGKTKAVIKDDSVILKIAMLKDFEPKAKKETGDKDGDGLPF